MASNYKPTDDDWKRLLKLIDSIYQRPDAEPFREPVPWKALGLTDYPTIIKTPMDLGTIKKKIQKRSYGSLFDVATDVRTVWTNCMTYNADGSDFFKIAENLNSKWEEKYKKYLSDIGVGSSSSNTGTTTAASAVDPAIVGSSATTAAAGGGGATAGTATSSSNKTTLQEKRNFAKLLYSITKEELGKILVDVETRHPAAIKRNATEDEVVLNVDEIPAPLLQDLFAFINSVKNQKKKTPSNTTANNTSTSKSNKKAKT